MPRLTAQDYYRHYQALRRIWQERPELFARLTPEEQWQLHDYFQPSVELTEAVALEHRKSITKQQPSLPARAGKILARFHASLRSNQPILGKDRHVGALARPTIDDQKIARACIELARHLAADKSAT